MMNYFYLLMKKSDNINSLNSIIKCDFILNNEIKLVQTFVTSGNKNNKDDGSGSYQLKSNLESNTNSILSASMDSSQSLLSNNMENNGKKNVMINKLNDEINKLMKIHPDFNKTDIDFESIKIFSIENMHKSSTIIKDIKDKEGVVNSDMFFIEKKTFIKSAISIKNIFLLGILLSSIFSSYYAFLIFKKIKTEEKINKLMQSISILSFQSIYENIETNYIMKKWMLSYINNIIHYDNETISKINIYSDDCIRKFSEIEDNINEYYMNNSYSLFSLQSNIKEYESRYNKEFSYENFYSKAISLNISEEEIYNNAMSIYNNYTVYDFLLNFINLSKERIISNGKNGYLSNNNTVDRLNILSSNLNSSELSMNNSFSLDLYISKVRKVLIDLNKSNNISDSSNFYLFSEALYTNIVILYPFNYMIRLIIIQEIIDGISLFKNVAFEELIYFIIILIIFYLIFQIFLLKRYLNKIFYERSVLLLFPIENIILLNHEIFKKINFFS